MNPDDLKDEYVRELRAIIWNHERLQALTFLYETQRAELLKMTSRTAGYRIVMARLFTRLMRLTG